MATRRELVSGVRGLHKILSSDSYINDRLIFSEIKRTGSLLIKRETNLRKLWATDTLFTTIPCLEMMEVPISECCDFVDECNIARSKYKLPKIGEGNYQYLIQGVYSINALSGTGKKLKEITVNRYTNLLKLPVIKKEEYYFIVNDYLYVTNPSVKAVRISASFEEDIPNKIMFPDCDCGTKATNEEICKNPLDLPANIPGYLEKQVLDLVSQKLLQTYFNLPVDKTSNSIDGQSPGSRNTD